MFRALDRWLPAYLLRSRQRPSGSPEKPIHVFIAVCDHFEPFHDTDKAGARRALAIWLEQWPRIVESFQDNSGRGPRHTFFYPIEQYDEDILALLTELCRHTGSEVEVHLHHRDDTAETLAAKFAEGTRHLASHGLLSRCVDGRPRYGFIHGNWALDHSHPRGLHCGVADELAVLKATGCYADFTLPSAPDPSQVGVINSIYYAREDGKPRSHARGTPVRAGISSVISQPIAYLSETGPAGSQSPATVPIPASVGGGTAALAASPDHLLLVQGPLGLNWHRRKAGLLPRIETGDLTGVNPPTTDRFQLWTQLCPFVADGPPWIFIKLHTHGGIPRNFPALIGEPARQFHAGLAALAGENPSMCLHYVTAREMVNLIHAAENGATDPALAWQQPAIPPPPILSR